MDARTTADQNGMLKAVLTAGIVVGNVQQRRQEYLQALSWQRESVQECARWGHKDGW